jgi:hypothetical protein
LVQRRWSGALTSCDGVDWFCIPPSSAPVGSCRPPGWVRHVWLDAAVDLVAPHPYDVISPVTKTNWEGAGVKPDVAVPADKALDTAYLAALDKVKATIDPKKRPGMAKEIDERSRS